MRDLALQRKYSEVNLILAVLFLFMSPLGYDLCSAYDTVIPARGKSLVKTDIAIAIPQNTYARIGKSVVSVFMRICW
jgi:hypothetical protein